MGELDGLFGDFVALDASSGIVGCGGFRPHKPPRSSAGGNFDWTGGRRGPAWPICRRLAGGGDGGYLRLDALEEQLNEEGSDQAGQDSNCKLCEECGHF